MSDKKMTLQDAINYALARAEKRRAPRLVDYWATVFPKKEPPAAMTGMWGDDPAPELPLPPRQPTQEQE